MAKYNVHIHGTSNVLSDPTFFIGTGFTGAPFDTIEELRDLLHKYASVQKNGQSYWREEIELTFNLGATVDAFKQEGYRQCAENGFVNLLTAVSVLRTDPFNGLRIVYRPAGWIDAAGNIFKFVLVKNNEVTPKYCKLRDILREIGMDI